MPSDCGTVTVTPPFDPNAVSTTSCASVPAEGTTGNDITVSTTVTNNNTQDAAVTVEIQQNGSTIGTTDVTVSDSMTVDFTVTLPSTAGDYSYTTSVASATEA